MKTKKDEKFSFLHTQQRLLERYGLSLNWKEYKTLSRDMKLANEYTSEKQGQRVATLMFKGAAVVVVFDEKRQRVTTVLPKTYKTKKTRRGPLVYSGKHCPRTTESRERSSDGPPNKYVDRPAEL